jgi:hypothetical protein
LARIPLVNFPPNFLPMKLPKVPAFNLAILAGISFVTPALAVINIDYATVGNVGNAADTTFDPGGYGAVGYVYNIGKY